MSMPVGSHRCFYLLATATADVHFSGMLPMIHDRFA
jgi:hypothetical protein